MRYRAVPATCIQSGANQSSKVCWTRINESLAFVYRHIANLWRINLSEWANFLPCGSGRDSIFTMLVTKVQSRFQDRKDTICSRLPLTELLRINHFSVNETVTPRLNLASCEL